MVNAGLVPITIADDYLANFWSKVFTHLQVHGDIALRLAATSGSPSARRIRGSAKSSTAGWQASAG